MNYKAIIRDRTVRVRILRFLSFIPDKWMIRLQYKIKTGRKLDLKDPQRFTEKLQWYKLYYKDPLMIKCVDKYEVRDYVKKMGFEKNLIPCYGVFETADSIDWDSLPAGFVMKDTLGGGGNSVRIVKNKDSENITELQATAAAWIATTTARKSSGREWPYYSGKKRRVIIEKLIQPSHSEDLNDFKFFCFNGKCEFLYVTGERKAGEKVKISIFDRNFDRLNVRRVGDELYEDAVKPENYTEMLDFAEKLSASFPHVRVDLYDVDGKIYFGELTFYNASGYMLYEPDSFDLEVGAKWKLPERRGTGEPV